MLEIETKIYVPELLRVPTLNHLMKLYMLDLARHHELNVLYDFPDGRLRSDNKTLRLRTQNFPNDMRVLLTFKNGNVQKDNDEFRHAAETEFPLPSLEAGQELFTGLGTQVVFTYEKYRTVFYNAAAETHIMFDETPMALFVEIEGEYQGIQDTMTQLMLDHLPRTKKSYRRLYKDLCFQYQYGQPIINSCLFSESSQYLFTQDGLLKAMKG